MLKRLATDQSLKAFGGQFVPLKLTTSPDNQEWVKWSSQYSHVGRTIPILFIIRADGVSLFNHSGSWPGNELNQLLAAAVEASGRIISSTDSDRLRQCCNQAELALADGQLFKAATSMEPVKTIGAIGDLQSYAQQAIRADRLAEKLAGQASKRLIQAEANLADEATRFDAMVEIMHVRCAFENFESVAEVARAAVARMEKVSSETDLRRPAELLAKARKLSASHESTNFSEKAYALVAVRYPESPAEALANEELLELNPESKAIAELAQLIKDGCVWPEEPFRQWSDASGKHAVEAKLVLIDETQVCLLKSDGRTVNVPVSGLGMVERDYLDQRR